MPIIKQDTLFDMHEFFEMEPTHRFYAIFSTLELAPLLRIFDKKTHRGRRENSITVPWFIVDRSFGGTNSND